MYLPIPKGVSHSVTVKASTPATDCEAASSTTRTATFTLAKSTTGREIQSDFILKSVVRPTDGKWSKIRESGSIKMTPMEIINERTTYHLGEISQPYIQVQGAVNTKHKAKVNGVCTNCRITDKWDVKVAVASGRYVEQGDLSYWKSKYPTAPHYVKGRGLLDNNQLEAAKSSVYAELFQAYNLGEDLAELKETLGSVTKLTKEAVNLILAARKTLNSMFVKKTPLKQVSERWMEFRYGIMPIMYSIRDAATLSGDCGRYRTARATVFSDIEVDEVENKPSVYFHDVGLHEERAMITAKGRWPSEELKRFDLININPLTTATAVLPWSMVVRWFFNVQSYLDVRIKSLTSLALEHTACVAIREKSEYGTYLSAQVGYDQSFIWNGWSQYCGMNYYGPDRLMGRWTDIYRAEVLLATTTRNNYKRYLFKPSDVKLVYAPHITWQRIFDGLILGQGKLSNLLRRLK